MAFTPIDYVLGMFRTNRDIYYKTPIPNNNVILLNGQPEMLNPDTWDAWEIFMTTPQLYAVINRKGLMMASGVWKHYRKDNKGNVIEVENSDYVKLLENPNPLLNGNDHIRQYVENLSIYGNNYEYILKAFSTALPDGLTNINPTTVTIKTSGKYYKQSKLEEIITGYEITTGTDIDKVDTKEINHTRIPNSFNPVKGSSPMRAIYMPVSNIRAAYQFRNVIMTKRGALGMLSNQSKSDMGAIPLMDDERKRIENEYQRSFGIGDEQQKLIMTNASLTYQAMSYPTKDLLLFEEVDADFRTIIDHYGLNDNLFSREKGSTFTNLAEGLKQAYQTTVIPEAEELAMNRSRMFGLLDKGEWLELDYSHIPVLQANNKEKAEILQLKANAISQLSQLGLYTPQDLRDIISLGTD